MVKPSKAIIMAHPNIKTHTHQKRPKSQVASQRRCEKPVETYRNLQIAPYQRPT